MLYTENTFSPHLSTINNRKLQSFRKQLKTSQRTCTGTSDNICNNNICHARTNVRHVVEPVAIGAK